MRATEVFAYLIKRLFMAAFVLVIISIMIFVTVRLAPGDPVLNKIGPYGDSSPENYQRVATELGLDKDLPTQYFIWLKNCLKLDFGVSLRSGASISETVLQKLPVSFELIITALVLALMISIPLGMIAAIHKGSILDQVISVFTSSFLAVPAFCTGLLMIIIFAVNLKWFPSNGYTPFSEDPVRNLKQLAMPAITLALFETAIITKHVRSQTLDVVGSNYIRTAKAKGVSGVKIIFGHALKNSLIPVITYFGPMLAYIVTGSLVVEQIFAVPGIGRAFVSSITNRDYPMVMGTTIVLAVLIVVMNLISDIMYKIIDPRINLE